MKMSRQELMQLNRQEFFRYLAEGFRKSENMSSKELEKENAEVMKLVRGLPPEKLTEVKGWVFEYWRMYFDTEIQCILQSVEHVFPSVQRIRSLEGWRECIPHLKGWQDRLNETIEHLYSTMPEQLREIVDEKGTHPSDPVELLRRMMDVHYWVEEIVGPPPNRAMKH